jgi:hypothetical protein
MVNNNNNKLFSIYRNICVIYLSFLFFNIFLFHLLLSFAIGRTFTLRDANVNGLRAPVKGGGRPGLYTQQEGILGYKEVINDLLFVSLNHQTKSLVTVRFALW